MSQIGKLQTWEIPPDKLNNWQRLNPHVEKEVATDCAINSLYLLGVIDNPDFAKILSDFANKDQRGMYGPEVLQLIYNKFNENNDSKINNYTMGFKTDEEIREELKDDTYTIAGYLRDNGQGHVVILTKQGDIIFVFDPQQETVYCELTDYSDWVNSQNFARDENGAPLIAYILQNKVTRKREETPVTLRNRISRSPSPSAKRRKTIRRKTKTIRRKTKTIRRNGGNRRRI